MMNYINQNVLIEDIIKRTRAYFNDEDLFLLKKAYNFAKEKHNGQKRETREDYIQHPLRVALILIEYGFIEVDCLVSALLHDTIEDCNLREEEITKTFNPTVANIVSSVTKSPKSLFKNSSELRLNYLKKIINSINGDFRIILIKLADRIDNMRTLFGKENEEVRKKIANETLYLYAPLAHYLSLYQIKNELEDLSFAYLNPSFYNYLDNQLSLLQELYEARISSFANKINELLNNYDINHQLMGDIKNKYEIAKDLILNPKQKINNIDDLFKLKIIVTDIRNCYQVLGLIQAKYRCYQIKDYINNRCLNGYQALHLIMNQKKNSFQINIATSLMEEMANKGIISYWRLLKEQREDFNNYRLKDLGEATVKMDSFLKTCKPETFLLHDNSVIELIKKDIQLEKVIK